MAAGLGLLGRGHTTRALPLGLLHIAGAAIAGALLGGLIGGVGALLDLAQWRPWIIAVAAFVALVLALRRTPPRLGRQRQVPRRWSPTTSPSRVYLAWGLMLGFGVATPVFHTAFVLLVGAQLTAGPWVGMLSGALFGLTRQAMALIPVLRQYEPIRIMGLLETLRPTARRLNTALVIVGGLLLMIASSR